MTQTIELVGRAGHAIQWDGDNLEDIIEAVGKHAPIYEMQVTIDPLTQNYENLSLRTEQGWLNLTLHGWVTFSMNDFDFVEQPLPNPAIYAQRGENGQD